LTRAETLKLYPEYDLFLFPSLHDTGGYAIIEAMACGLPVICLDCGGPRVAVKNGAGTRIRLGSRHKVIAGLADALRQYDGDRQLLGRQGAEAREVVLRDYDWNKKGRLLDVIYQKAVAEKTEHSATLERAPKSGLRGLFRRLFPVRSLAVSSMILLVIGTAGFLSVNYLKRNAEMIVQDTLPGLSNAGAANSSLAEAFNRTLLMVMAVAPEERAKYLKESNEFSRQTAESLALYQRAPFTQDELAIYNQVLDRRSKYLTVREEALKLAEAGRQSEALAICKNQMLQAYLDYKFSAEKLLVFNTRQGVSRGETILSICATTQYIVAGIGILLFAVGFLIGLFK
jgi:hypothetical protein